MIENRTNSDRLQPLLAAMLDGQLRDEQIAELRRLLAADPAARKQYVRQVATHGMLQWAIGGKTNDDCGTLSDELPADLTSSDIIPSDSTVSFPSLSTIRHPLQTSFVDGPVFSYMDATVILGVMLFSAWAYKIAHQE